MKLKIGCFQLALKKTDNFELIINKINNFLSKNSVDMIILSELAVGGPGAKNERFYLNNYIDKFSDIALKNNIWLIPGTFYEKLENKIFNVAPVINNSGKVVAKAYKMFPWLPYEENVEMGNQFCTFEYPGFGNIGIHICYDLWFPESSRQLSLNGSIAIINPTLTPTKDRDIETIMVRATAAQQQLYYIDINSTGEQGNGLSIISDPCGEVIHQSSDSEDIFIIEICSDYVEEVRKEGMYKLGQPIKSFRDHPYFRNSYTMNSEYLDSLGKLKKPDKQ